MKRSACFLCLCSPLVSLLQNIRIQPIPNHQVFPSENVPGGRDGDRGGNEHSLAFLFSQKNARQMVAQRFLPFSLIAPHPGCLGKQCSSTHICNEISKAAASPAAPDLLWVPLPVFHGWAFIPGPPVPSPDFLSPSGQEILGCCQCLLSCPDSLCKSHGSGNSFPAPDNQVLPGTVPLAGGDSQSICPRYLVTL